MEKLSTRIPLKEYELLTQLSAEQGISLYECTRDAVTELLMAKGLLPRTTTIGDVIKMKSPLSLPKRRVREPKPVFSEALKGKSLLMFGGKPKANMSTLIRESLLLSSFEWKDVENNPRLTNQVKEMILAHDIIVVNRMISHPTQYQIKDYAQRKEKVFAFMPRGIGPTAIISALTPIIRI